MSHSVCPALIQESGADTLQLMAQGARPCVGNQAERYQPTKDVLIFRQQNLRRLIPSYRDGHSTRPGRHLCCSSLHSICMVLSPHGVSISTTA